MKNLCGIGVGRLLLAGLVLMIVPGAGGESSPRGIHERKHDTSLPLREMARKVVPVKGPLYEKPEGRAPRGYFHQVPGIDSVAQSAYLPGGSTTQLLSFDAITGSQGQAIPPDTNGSVGSRQFVEITNVVFEVFDKTNGQVILGPTLINALWSGFGGLCESTNGGDPIILWDKLAQRWFISQLAYNRSEAALCLAVSTTSDATGSFNRYEFSTGLKFPDYPKYSVWPDAYYGTNNLYGTRTFLGAEPCAFDRTAMLKGKVATEICMTPDASNYGFLPSDMDGSTPPPHGEPNHYVELGNLTNQLKEFDFHVDFANPTKSTFKGPNVIPVPTFTLLCHDGGDFACVPQPSPGERIDSLSGLLMFRLAYRNFGDHESIVAAHAVKPSSASTATVATRWYELRSRNQGKFSLYQSGTFQDKIDNLWMASIAMDKQGDIAMGMSADSSSSLYPSIWYTGRVPTDALGKMETPTVVVTGSSVQAHGGNRWGDYSSMSVDPSDDCTFWYAQEYYNKTNGGTQSNDWTSHLVSFKFNGCK